MLTCAVALFLAQSVATFQDLASNPNACAINEEKIAAATESITKEYEQQFKALSDQTQNEAAGIDQDTPDPSSTEAALNADIEIGSRQQKVILNIPQFTMAEQDVVLSVPQSTMKRQEWHYKIPASRMKLKCIDGPPEIVCPTKMRCVLGICTKVPDGPCRTRPNRICTNVPEFYMNEVTTILDVPEVRMATQTLKTKIPQTTMVQKTIVFNVPTVTIRNVRAEFKESKERSDELQARTNEQSENLAAAMKRDVESANAKVIGEQYECTRNQLDAVLQNGLVHFDNQIAILEAARQKAIEVGATEVADQNATAIEQLIAAKNKFADDTRAAMAQLSPQEQIQVNRALSIS